MRSTDGGQTWQSMLGGMIDTFTSVSLPNVVWAIAQQQLAANNKPADPTHRSAGSFFTPTLPYSPTCYGLSAGIVQSAPRMSRMSVSLFTFFVGRMLSGSIRNSFASAVTVAFLEPL